MNKLFPPVIIAMAASTAHAQSALEADYCQRQAEYEYQLRIQTPPIFPEVYPGWKGGQAGQAAAYAGSWSQRVFMECMRSMEEDLPRIENNGGRK